MAEPTLLSEPLVEPKEAPFAGKQLQLAVPEEQGPIHGEIVSEEGFGDFLKKNSDVASRASGLEEPWDSPVPQIPESPEPEPESFLLGDLEPEEPEEKVSLAEAHALMGDPKKPVESASVTVEPASSPEAGPKPAKPVDEQLVLEALHSPAPAPPVELPASPQVAKTDADAGVVESQAPEQIIVQKLSEPPPPVADEVETVTPAPAPAKQPLAARRRQRINQPPKELPKIGWVRRVLIDLSGAAPDLFDEDPQREENERLLAHERSAYPKMGLSVLVPCTLAFIASAFTIFTLVRDSNHMVYSVSCAAIGGLIWAALVLNMDLAIMPELKKEVSLDPDDRWRVLKYLSLPGKAIVPCLRLLAAAVMGLVMSHCLILAIFSKKIAEELNTPREKQRLALKSEYEGTKEKLSAKLKTHTADLERIQLESPDEFAVDLKNQKPGQIIPTEPPKSTASAAPAAVASAPASGAPTPGVAPIPVPVAAPAPQPVQEAVPSIEALRGNPALAGMFVIWDNLTVEIKKQKTIVDELEKKRDTLEHDRVQEKTYGREGRPAGDGPMYQKIVADVRDATAKLATAEDLLKDKTLEKQKVEKNFEQIISENALSQSKEAAALAKLRQEQQKVEAERILNQQKAVAATELDAQLKAANWRDKSAASWAKIRTDAIQSESEIVHGLQTELANLDTTYQSESSAIEREIKDQSFDLLQQTIALHEIIFGDTSHVAAANVPTDGQPSEALSAAHREIAAFKAEKARSERYVLIAGYCLILGLFYILDTLPLLIKILKRPTGYDYKVAAQNYKKTTQSQITKIKADATKRIIEKQWNEAVEKGQFPEEALPKVYADHFSAYSHPQSYLEDTQGEVIDEMPEPEPEMEEQEVKRLGYSRPKAAPAPRVAVAQPKPAAKPKTRQAPQARAVAPEADESENTEMDRPARNPRFAGLLVKGAILCGVVIAIYFGRSLPISSSIASLFKGSPAPKALTGAARDAALPKYQDKSIAELTGLAGNKDPLAQYVLGDKYFNGKDTDKNPAEGMKWFRSAAELGDVTAQFDLGLCYLSGVGIAQDAAEGAKWLRKSADLGDARAQYNLALCHERGEGVAKDAAESVKLYHQSAVQGYAPGQTNLAERYMKGEGVAQNYVEAYRWASLAAAQGVEKASQMITTLQGLMTHEQLEEAQRLASDFKLRVANK